MCEGDDYWILPYKFQKQVDFLEANPEYWVVHDNCHFYYEKNGKWEYNTNKHLSNSIEIDSKEKIIFSSN